MSLQFNIPSQVGYDYEFLPALEEKYECVICLLGLRYPMQTKCGHRFCRDCIHLHLREVGSKCPIDNTPITESDIFLDSCVEREILQLKIRCPNNKLGCKVEVELKYITNHTQACSYQPVMCPNDCSSTILQKELSDHITEHCVDRIIKCEKCNQTHKYKDEQLHLINCSEVTVPCDLCMERMPRGNIHIHRTEKCSKVIVSCPFVEHGCTKKMKRELIDQHMIQASNNHLICLSSVVKKINTVVNDLGRSIGFSGSFSRQPSLKSQISSYPMTEEHEFSDDSNVSCVPNKGQVAATNDIYDDDPKKVVQPSFADNIMKDLSEKTLDMDQRTVEQSIQIDSLSHKISILQKNMEMLSLAWDNGRLSFGEHLWQVHDFPNQCIEMCANSKHTLFSLPFYNKPNEYKFCVRLNITKKDNIFYITLNIHLMKGENDHILNWPFSGKLSIAILDCSNKYPKKHIIEYMETRSTMTAFERPVTIRNSKGFGFTEFVKLSDVDCINSPYIKDNTLFIKATALSNT